MRFGIKIRYCLQRGCSPLLIHAGRQICSWCQTQAYRSPLFSFQGSSPCHGEKFVPGARHRGIGLPFSLSKAFLHACCSSLATTRVREVWTQNPVGQIKIAKSCGLPETWWGCGHNSGLSAFEFFPFSLHLSHVACVGGCAAAESWWMLTVWVLLRRSLQRTNGKWSIQIVENALALLAVSRGCKNSHYSVIKKDPSLMCLSQSVKCRPHRKWIFWFLTRSQQRVAFQGKNILPDRNSGGVGVGKAVAFGPEISVFEPELSPLWFFFMDIKKNIRCWFPKQLNNCTYVVVTSQICQCFHYKRSLWKRGEATWRFRKRWCLFLFSRVSL